MRLRPYQEYQECELPWLHSIPAHWGLMQMKRVFVERVQKGYPDEPLLAATQTKGVVPKDQYGARTVVATKDLHLLKLVEPGDYVISLRSFEGGIEHSDYRGIISPAYTVLKPSPDVIDGYFRPLLKCEPFVSGLTLFVTGIREGQNIDYDRLSRSTLPFPPHNEQRAIGSLLRTIVPYINRLIRAKRRQIELLNEQKQAIIHMAVTRGLDPNVRLKPSEIKWLSDIPEHWRAVGFGRVLRGVEQGWSPLPAEGEAADNQWAVLALSAVKRGAFHKNEIKPLPLALDVPSSLEVQRGDFLLTRSNTRRLVGDVCIVGNAPPRLMLSDLIYRLRVDESQAIPRFLMYELLSSFGRSQIESDARGSSGTMVKLSQGHIKRWTLVLPPLSEQVGIATYLDGACSEVERTVSAIEHQIDCLREYRTRLIADIITGKLDVRGVEVPDLGDADIADGLCDSDFDSDTDQDDLPDAEEVEADGED